MSVKSTIDKAKNLSKETGQYVVKNPKTVLYIGAGVVAIIAAYKLYKAFFPGEEKLPDLDVDYTQPISTISDAQAQLIAERLYNAMSGTGTDEDEIFDALSGLTVNDFVKVYDKFGMRQYSLFWGNVGDPLTSGKHHLITWLTNELNTDEINQLKAMIPGLEF